MHIKVKKVQGISITQQVLILTVLILVIFLEELKVLGEIFPIRVRIEKLL